MERKSKRDWFWACNEILIHEGAQAITIEALCQKVGVTKGSFYHHFKGIADFISAYLIFFEQEGTLEIIETVEEENTPEAKIRKLIAISVSYPPELEVSLRAWAHQNEAVQAVFERVDQQRLAYLTELWRPLTKDEVTAKARGQMMYAILIGGEHLLPPLSKENLAHLFEVYLEAFGL